jgi:hypothetical protein
MNRSLLGILGLIFAFAFGELLGADPNPVRLFVKEVPLTVLGKEIRVIAIESGTYWVHSHCAQKQELVRTVVRATCIKGRSAVTNQPAPSADAITHRDCIALMAQCPAGASDFILTDPPYLSRYRCRTEMRARRISRTQGSISKAVRSFDLLGIL